MCQKYILTPISKEEIPSLYPNKHHCIKFLHDKAQSHISKFTALSFEKMRNETKIEGISFKCIPPKSFDVSPMDYYVLLDIF